MDEKGEQIAKAKWEATEAAREVMEHLYRALLATPAMKLANGKRVQVESYYAPEVDDDGELTCGVDVVFDNGDHLEFTMKNSGWGKSFVAKQAKRAGKQGRQR